MNRNNYKAALLCAVLCVVQNQEIRAFSVSDGLQFIKRNPIFFVSLVMQFPSIENPTFNLIRRLYIIPGLIELWAGWANRPEQKFKRILNKTTMLNEDDINEAIDLINNYNIRPALTNEKGQSLLMLTCLTNNNNLVTKLLNGINNKNIDINQSNSHDKRTALKIAIQNNNPDIVKILLINKADPNIPKDNPPLKFSVALLMSTPTNKIENRIKIIKLLLNSPNIDINQSNSNDKRTALVVAIARKIKISNESNENEDKKLLYNAYSAIIDLLIQHGAIITNEMIIQADNVYKQEDNLTEQGKNAYKELIDKLNQELKNVQEQIQQQQQQNTVDLLDALKNGYHNKIEALLKKPLNINAQNKNGWTPLMFASKNATKEHDPVVNQMLEKYGKFIDPNLKSLYDDTALSLAIKNGRFGIANQLLNYNTYATPIVVHARDLEMAQTYKKTVSDEEKKKLATVVINSLQEKLKQQILQAQKQYIPSMKSNP